MNLEPIDTSTTAGKIEVMQLAGEGRKLIWRPKGHGQWRKPPVEWNWADNEYAIVAKPVGPAERWILVDDDGTIWACSDRSLAEANEQVAVRYIRADLAGEVKA